MHGLINRSIQCFLRDTYGEALWRDVLGRAHLPPEGFEAMLHYPDPLTDAMIDAAAARLGKPRAALLEDLGAYLVTREPLRRLMRFGGTDYGEFLLSLEELQGRGLMALPDLDLPEIRLTAATAGRFVLEVRAKVAGWGPVLAGLLRAMADDYGALAIIELQQDAGGHAQLQVSLHETQFYQGRQFDLASPVVAQ